MYEIFEELLKIFGITPYKVSKDTGIPQSTLSTWKTKKNKIGIDNAEILAKYFDVSIDYLMGQTSYIQTMDEGESHLDALLNEYPIDSIKLISKLCKTERINKDLTEKYVASNTDISLNDYLDFENEFKNIGLFNIIRILNFYKINLYYITGYLTGTLMDRKLNENEFSNLMDRLYFSGKLKEAIVMLSQLNSEELEKIVNSDPYIALNSKDIDELSNKMKNIIKESDIHKN